MTFIIVSVWSFLSGVEQVLRRRRSGSAEEYVQAAKNGTAGQVQFTANFDARIADEQRRKGQHDYKGEQNFREKEPLYMKVDTGYGFD